MDEKAKRLVDLVSIDFDPRFNSKIVEVGVTDTSEVCDWVRRYRGDRRYTGTYFQPEGNNKDFEIPEAPLFTKFLKKNAGERRLVLKPKKYSYNEKIWTLILETKIQGTYFLRMQRFGSVEYAKKYVGFVPLEDNPFKDQHVHLYYGFDDSSEKNIMRRLDQNQQIPFP